MGLQNLNMFAITARNLIPIGRVGLRTIATKSKPNNNGFKKVKVLVGTAGAAGVGAVVYSGAAVAKGTPDWKQIREDIEELLGDPDVSNPSVDNGVQGGGGFVAPMMLRLAWHCSGTYCKTAQNGGSDGATMRFKPECDHGGNAGLGIARNLLEPIKAKHPNVTYADLYILAGVVAIEEMGGPKVRTEPIHSVSFKGSSDRSFFKAFFKSILNSQHLL